MEVFLKMNLQVRRGIQVLTEIFDNKKTEDCL